MYEWEKNQSGAADGGGGDAFADSAAAQHLSPANTGAIGHYLVDGGQQAHPSIFDMQIVLNEDEYKMIQSRRRAKRAEDKHAARTRKAADAAATDSKE